MSLREQIKTVKGNKRRFILLRIADMDTKPSLKLIGVVRGTYNSWCQNKEFVKHYRQVKEWQAEYKQEAIQLLRRDNQLDAVLLESRIIGQMKREIDTGSYELIKTNLAKEVYSRLLNDLDYQPKSLSLTWEERMRELDTGLQAPQIEQGGDIDGEVITPNSESETEHKTSESITEGIQAGQQAQEETGD